MSWNWRAYVGLDWADRCHVISLQAFGSRETESCVLEQKPDALHEWIAQLRARFNGDKVGIAIEQTRGAVIHAMMMYDFLELYPINPKALARFREAFRVSGAKDDPSDAELLMDLLRLHATGCALGCRIPWKHADCRYWPNIGANSSITASAIPTGSPVC